MVMLFPWLIVGVFIGCTVESLVDRHWNDAVYSFAAAVLNFFVYFRPFDR